MNSPLSSTIATMSAASNPPPLTRWVIYVTSPHTGYSLASFPSSLKQALRLHAPVNPPLPPLCREHRLRKPGLPRVSLQAPVHRAFGLCTVEHSGQSDNGLWCSSLFRFLACKPSCCFLIVLRCLKYPEKECRCASVMLTWLVCGSSADMAAILPLDFVIYFTYYVCGAARNTANDDAKYAICERMVA